MKKKKDIYSLIRELRKDIRVKINNDVQKRYDEALKEDKHPWGGLWLTSDEISHVQQRLEKKDRIVFIELIGLFALLALLSLLFLQIIFVALPGQTTNTSDRRVVSSVSDSSRTAALEEAVPLFNSDRKHAGKEGLSRPGADNVLHDAGMNNHTAEPKNGSVNTRILRMRQGPGLKYPIINRLHDSDIVTIMERSGSWLRVTTESSADGWVVGKYIESEL